MVNMTGLVAMVIVVKVTGLVVIKMVKITRLVNVALVKKVK